MSDRRPVSLRMTLEELAALDARAQERNIGRSDMLRLLVKRGSERGPVDEGLDEEQLVALLEVRARAGNVRAIELLLKRVQTEEAPAAVQGPFSEVDELAARRAR